MSRTKLGIHPALLPRRPRRSVVVAPLQVEVARPVPAERMATVAPESVPVLPALPVALSRGASWRVALAAGLAGLALGGAAVGLAGRGAASQPPAVVDAGTAEVSHGER